MILNEMEQGILIWYASGLAIGIVIFIIAWPSVKENYKKPQHKPK